MGPQLDPLRYGLRALEEMAREQASVEPPLPSQSQRFSPHPVLRPPSHGGAALSLRLFTDADDDATAFVLGDTSSRRFDPIPPRAAPLFEAHAAVIAAGAEEAITVGFPLVTFTHHGTRRAAPLFSRGAARVRWTTGDTRWTLPATARRGAPFDPPDALILEFGDDEAYALHAGVWHFLFGLDGGALGAISRGGLAGLGALVRTATRTLESGGEDTGAESVATSSLTRDDLTALAEAAVARAPRSRALRSHPHGLAMLLPRGDPTSALRTDVRAVLDEPWPTSGPLAVYLGAPSGSSPGLIFTSGKVPPTPSQLDAARAFEGCVDIVAVCGPPGCGKTALLHHVAAQTVVSCALGGVWSGEPSRSTPWPLVVTSTNNAAVDQALAPFVSGAGLPIGIRLGNRRTLAETTAVALTSAIAAIEAIETGGDVGLAEARAAFETRAAPVRSFLREAENVRRAQLREAKSRQTLERRVEVLRQELAVTPETPPPRVSLPDLANAERALREHAEAATKLAPLHLEGKKASVTRACEKWARANAVRAPRIARVLAELGLQTPFGDLDPVQPREDIARQRAAMEAAIVELVGARRVLAAPALRGELANITAKLGSVSSPQAQPPLDPALYEAALVVRTAWARAHRATLIPRLRAARDAALGEGAEARSKPLSSALRELASLFPLAGCTLLSMRSSFPLERDSIDRLVVDEAAQCAPIYVAPALARARRAMMTGDTAQLPPVYTLDLRVDERLARGLDELAIAPFRMSAVSTSSAQAVAEMRVQTRRSLTEHFRSQPAIVLLASRWSGYSLDVRTPPRSLAGVSSRLQAAVAVFPVRGAGARAAEGIVNECEATVAVEVVAELLADGVAPADIAVLTPFVGQAVRIESELVARGLLTREGVLVSTVHRLQGGERRVVIFSVTATERRHLRWLAERPHLLHVATSRAQDHLIVLLDPVVAAREPALAPFRELLAPGLD